MIQVPIFLGEAVGTQYDWNLLTVNQTQLDSSRRPLPQGRVLGGGSILNGMVWNRGSRADYDAWETLGNPGWGWDGMLPYFRKASETSQSYFWYRYRNLTNRQLPRARIIHLLPPKPSLTSTRPITILQFMDMMDPFMSLTLGSSTISRVCTAS